MVAVGLWGAQLGKPAIWLLPIAFPMMMMLGAMLGLMGVPLPGVEVGIAVSAIVLGLMVAFAVRPPIWVAALLAAMLSLDTLFRSDFEDGALEAALEALRRLPRRGRRGLLVIEKIDGQPVRDSAHHAEMLRCGFISDYRGLAAEGYV